MTTKTLSVALKTNRRLKRYQDIRELIGSPADPTPLVRLRRLSTEMADIYLKLEWLNPFGSIKDRPAYRMLKIMEQEGLLEGKEIVEPTSGNTGIALAALAAIMGKMITVTIPDGVPEEKKLLLRMLGATVYPTPDDLCPVDHPKDGAIALAHSFVEGEDTKDRYVMPNQYENQNNMLAHYETTGPEIWNQTEGRVTHFFAGVGTCGTLTGVGKYLKEQNPDIRVIAIEPQKNHKLPGLKNLQESKEPSILDRQVVDEFARVNDDDAYELTKRLFREEGLMVGPSTGAIVHLARKVCGKEGGLAVAVSPDSGLKYTTYFANRFGGEG